MSSSLHQWSRVLGSALAGLLMCLSWLLGAVERGEGGGVWVRGWVGGCHSVSWLGWFSIHPLKPQPSSQRSPQPTPLSWKHVLIFLGCHIPAGQAATRSDTREGGCQAWMALCRRVSGCHGDLVGGECHSFLTFAAQMLPSAPVEAGEALVSPAPAWPPSPALTFLEQFHT